MLVDNSIWTVCYKLQAVSLLLLIIIFSVVTSTEEAESSDDDEELGESILETVEVELGTLHLREYEIQPSRHRKKRKKKEANKMDDGGKTNSFSV